MKEKMNARLRRMLWNAVSFRVGERFSRRERLAIDDRIKPVVHGFDVYRYFLDRTIP